MNPGLSRAPSPSGSKETAEDPLSLGALKRLAEPTGKAAAVDPNIIDLGTLSRGADSSSGFVVPKVMAPPTLAELRAPASREALTAVGATDAPRPSLGSRLMPVVAVVGVLGMVGAGVLLFRAAKAPSPPQAAVPSAPQPTPVVTAAAAPVVASAAPEEPAVAAVNPGERSAKAEPSSSAVAPHAVAAAAPRSAPAASRPMKKAEPKPATAPVDPCDVKCRLEKAMRNRHK